MAITERDLRALGLSATSLDAIPPTTRSAIARGLEDAARELCATEGPAGAETVTGVAVNLLSDETQLTTMVAGPLGESFARSGYLDQFRVIPASASICAHTLATPGGYLDLSDPGETSRALTAHLSETSGGLLLGYAGVVLEVDGRPVGTLCLYGTKQATSDGRRARESALRRMGALLSSQLQEAARLTADNARMEREIRGMDSASVGEGGVYRDAAEAASWREVVAILGDVEAAVAATGTALGGMVACVIELRPARNEVAIVATSESGVARHGLRPCVVRSVGDDDLVAYWRAALETSRPPQGPHVHQERTLASALSPARLGTAPGAYASMIASPLPTRSGHPGTTRGLVVFAAREPSTDTEAAARAALVGGFTALVADAQSAALGVFTTRLPEDRLVDELAPDPAIMARVRSAFGSLKLKALLTLAEDRGVSGADDVESVEELLVVIARHATRTARERRSQLELLPVRELIAIGVGQGAAALDQAETKRDLVEAILEAEGLFRGHVPSAVPPALPVPPRPRRIPSPEQTRVAFDPGASWLRAAAQRANESYPSSLSAAWDSARMPRPVVPENETLRAEVIERLDIGDIREWSAADLATFDSIATGAAAVAGATFGGVTLLQEDEQIIVGITHRDFMQPMLSGGARAQPRATSLCQYVVAKGAPLAVVDTFAAENEPLGTMIRESGAGMPDALAVPPRSYLGVPLATSDGVVLGSFCIIDTKPRPDFVENTHIVEQLEAMAASVVNLFELRRLRSENARLSARRQLDLAAVAPLGRGATPGTMPVDRVALVFTDIEGSTVMHERDPALMKRALEVHDAVLRRAISDNGGIELATEGDAFTAAFHSAADAIRCCFDAQLRLMTAPWPEGLERLGPAETDQERMLRGCRVRMTVHFAEAGGGLLGTRAFQVSRHSVTRRPQYRGRVVEEGRLLSEMPSGGQVLVTASAFDEVSLALTSALGDPRVVDLGRYEAVGLGDLGHVYELMPRALSARRFDPPIRLPESVQLVAPGYIHAPRTSPLVVSFVLPVGMAELRQESDTAHSRGFDEYAGAIRTELALHGGYEMKENEGVFMCAFSDARDALEFGAAVHARVRVASRGGLGCKVGIHGGTVSIEPHGRTGRLEAFGPPCNRAARLAKSANAGQTLVDSETAAAAQREGVALPLHDLGDHRFRGVDDPIRVIQVGEESYPPIQSLDYGMALVRYGVTPAAQVPRARAVLAMMDSLGVDSMPAPTGGIVERAEVLRLVDDGLASVQTGMTATRFGVERG